MTVETNTLDYTLVAILLIMMKEKEIHLVTFHSYIYNVIVYLDTNIFPCFYLFFLI